MKISESMWLKQCVREQPDPFSDTERQHGVQEGVCVCVLSGETEEKPTKCLQGERRYDYLVQYISHDRVMGSHRSLFLISLQSEAFGAG